MHWLNKLPKYPPRSRNIKMVKATFGKIDGTLFSSDPSQNAPVLDIMPLATLGAQTLQPRWLQRFTPMECFKFHPQLTTLFKYLYSYHFNAVY